MEKFYRQKPHGRRCSSGDSFAAERVPSVRRGIEPDAANKAICTFTPYTGMETNTNREQSSHTRLDPLNDYLFYKIMGEKGSEIQLLGFLNAVLEKSGKGPFHAVEILENKSFSADADGDKSVTFDVRAVLLNGVKVNVEVQLRNHRNMDKRSLYYWSKEYSSSLKSGQNYNELPNVIAINIVNFDYPQVKELNAVKPFHTCFHLREDRYRDLVLTDVLEIHYLNMVQFRKHGRDKTLQDPLCRWLAWFDKNSPPELLSEVIGMDSAIKEADERMVYITGDQDAIDAYERRFKMLCDRAWHISNEIEDAKDEGRAEGRVEGRAEGRAEGKAEIAKKLKAINLPLAQIAEVTGLTMEAIEQL